MREDLMCTADGSFEQDCFRTSTSESYKQVVLLEVKKNKEESGRYLVTYKWQGADYVENVKPENGILHCTWFTIKEKDCRA